MDESNSRATTEIGRVKNQDVGARIKEIVKKKRKKKNCACACATLRLLRIIDGQYSRANASQWTNLRLS